MQPWRRISERALLAELPDLARRSAGAPKRRPVGDDDADDALRRVAPAVYATTRGTR